MATVVVAACALAGCLLTSSLDGLAGAPPAADAGGALPADAGDAGDAGDAQGTHAGADASDLCTGSAFCDRFERDNLQGDHDSVIIDPGSSLTLAAPRAGDSKALHVAVGGGKTSASLRKSFDGGKRIELAYSVLLEGPAARSNLMQLTFSFDRGHREQELIFLMENDGRFRLAEQQLIDGEAKQFFSYPAVPLPTGRWLRVSLLADFGVTPQHVRVLIDDVEMVNADLQLPYGAAKFELYTGVHFATGGPAYAIDIDDVRLDPGAP